MLDRLIERCRTAPVHSPEGVVSDVVGLIVEVGGINAAVGDTLRVQDPSGARLDVEVVGFRGGRLLTTPLGPLVGIRPGARATRLMRGATVPVSMELLGRVVDSFGRPLDGGPNISADRVVPVNAPPPRHSRAGRSIASWRRACAPSTPCCRWASASAWASSPAPV